jgi:hypothetical protein
MLKGILLSINVLKEVIMKTRLLLILSVLFPVLSHGKPLESSKIERNSGMGEEKSLFERLSEKGIGRIVSSTDGGGRTGGDGNSGTRTTTIGK